MTPRRGWLIASLLLLAHLGLSLHAARHLSPTWDEITYPVAGVSQWRTRSILLNREHAFLSKLLYALPLLPQRPEIPVLSNALDQYRAGFLFTFHNRVSPKRLIFWSRVPAALFSVLTGLFLFAWMGQCWGVSGGLISLLCYLSTPILLSRASLAHLEAPMYFFILLALWSHAKAHERDHAGLQSLSGAATGLALLCKLPALPLLPTFLVLEFWHGRRSLSKAFKRVFILLGSVAAVIFLAYLPWHGAWDAFNDTFVNLFLFNRILPYFWHGELYARGPWYLSWAAWFIKSPLIVLALCLGGAACRTTTPEQAQAQMYFKVFLVMCFLSVLFFGTAVTSIQFSPAHLALSGLAAALTLRLQTKTAQCLLGSVFLIAFMDAYRVHPNYLAYFNEFVGGPKQGYRWLADSDQDWGQSLPALGNYLQKEGNPSLVLAYSGAGNPRAEGLAYQDLYSPALVSKEYQGDLIQDREKPIYLAVATKVFQSEPRLFTWLEAHLTPKALVSYSFFIYDITHEPEAYRWMGAIYLATRRAGSARWAFERAATLDPGNPSDTEVLSRLKRHPA